MRLTAVGAVGHTPAGEARGVEFGDRDGVADGEGVFTSGEAHVDGAGGMACRCGRREDRTLRGDRQRRHRVHSGDVAANGECSCLAGLGGLGDAGRRLAGEVVPGVECGEV